MKKVILISFCVFAFCTTLCAWEPIPLMVCIDDNTMPIGHGHTKSPIAPPTVYLEDNTLSFVPDHPEYVLYIKDEDEEVAYSTVVTSAETQVTLPTYLTGSYKIELVMGNWCFWGYITL